jgi:hypothetical protein
MMLTTPPNTPLHNQFMHPQMMYHSQLPHMPHVPMPGPFDSPYGYDFLGPAYPPYHDSYDDRRREKRRRRDREVRRTPSSSPEPMDEEKKDNEKKEQS